MPSFIYRKSRECPRNVVYQQYTPEVAMVSQEVTHEREYLAEQVKLQERRKQLEDIMGEKIAKVTNKDQWTAYKAQFLKDLEKLDLPYSSENRQTQKTLEGLLLAYESHFTNDLKNRKDLEASKQTYVRGAETYEVDSNDGTKGIFNVERHHSVGVKFEGEPLWKWFHPDMDQFGELNKDGFRIQRPEEMNYNDASMIITLDKNKKGNSFVYVVSEFPGYDRYKSVIPSAADATSVAVVDSGEVVAPAEPDPHALESLRVRVKSFATDYANLLGNLNLDELDNLDYQQLEGLDKLLNKVVYKEDFQTRTREEVVAFVPSFIEQQQDLIKGILTATLVDVKSGMTGMASIREDNPNRMEDDPRLRSLRFNLEILVNQFVESRQNLTSGVVLSTDSLEKLNHEELITLDKLLNTVFFNPDGELRDQSEIESLKEDFIPDGNYSDIRQILESFEKSLILSKSILLNLASFLQKDGYIRVSDLETINNLEIEEMNQWESLIKAGTEGENGLLSKEEIAKTDLGKLLQSGKTVRELLEAWKKEF